MSSRAVQEQEDMDREKTEEEFRKRMEPVAPWNRDNIPDYGPLQDRQHLWNFLAIGVLMTLIYEFTTFFSEIQRWLAYCAIWLPLWFVLLSRLAPKPVDEDELLKQQQKQETHSFENQLKRIAQEDQEEEEDQEDDKKNQ